jgi:hypothetical protein
MAPIRSFPRDLAESNGGGDLAGLNDFREIALTEIQICPDDGGWVAVRRIDQTD